MTSRHPARWQNVLPGSDAASASQAESWPSSSATEIMRGQGLCDRREAELREQALEPRERAPKTAVMPHVREPRHLEARLLRIDLPGVDVERTRRAAALAVAERGARDGVGEQTEVGTAPRRPCHAAAPQRGGWQFREPAGRALEPVDRKSTRLNSS